MKTVLASIDFSFYVSPLPLPLHFFFLTLIIRY
jgi:hypothetical protein